MPPSVVERLALELLRILLLVFVPVVFIVIAEQVDGFVLPAQHADRRLHRAHIDRAEQHYDIDKLELLHLARRLRIDQHRHVWRRTFQRELRTRDMLNARLARCANFRGPP